jgi:PEGA domain-containing protein
MQLNKIGRSFLLVLFIFVAVSSVQAQGAAEYAGVTSAVATAAAGAKIKAKPPTLPSAKEGPRASAPQPVVRSGEAAATANRQALEGRAGPDAARVLLRSMPEQVQVWIDARFVGSTPFELKLAPGHHEILMRAPDMASLRQSIELQGKQTREVLMRFDTPPRPGDSKPKDN